MDTEILDTYRDCPLCLKLLFEPVSTLCGHTFCLLCMERFISTFNRSLQCPICRDDLSYLLTPPVHLKTNIILHNLFRQQYKNEYELRQIEIETERKSSIKRRLIIGNSHAIVSHDDDRTRHTWTLFIKFDNDGKDDIADFVKQVKITLHPTFTPSQIVLDQAPFRLTRIGWGIFTIYLSLKFHDRWNKSDLMTTWFLSFTNAGDQKTMEIEFQQLSDDIKND